MSFLLLTPGSEEWCFFIDLQNRASHDLWEILIVIIVNQDVRRCGFNVDKRTDGRERDGVHSSGYVFI